MIGQYAFVFLVAGALFGGAGLIAWFIQRMERRERELELERGWSED